MIKTYDLVVRGNLVLPEAVISGGWLAIAGSTIVDILPAGADPRAAARTVIDAGAAFVLPGGIDAHVHSGSSSLEREGFLRLTRAAARGGVTTVFDMPYDAPEPVISAERLERKIEEVETDAVVDVALYGTIAKTRGAAAIVPLARAGAIAFKFSTYETDPARFPEIEDSELVQAFAEIAKTGRLVAFHAENGAIVDPLVAAMYDEGVDHPEAHCLSRPPVSETTAVLKLLELARSYPVPLHIAHLTVPEGYDYVAWFRSLGVDATAETCIQYLVLDQHHLTQLRGLAKCNPPLRPKEMQEQLWQKLLSGSIDFVTSDHAPWSLRFKSDPNIFDNKSGLPGVETLLPLLYSHGVVDRGLDIRVFARLIATAPAQRFGLYPRKGALVVGSDADITVIDPAQEFIVDAAASESIAKWSPYNGMRLKGRVVRTIVRGQTIFDGREVLAQAGCGRFQKPCR